MFFFSLLIFALFGWLLPWWCTMAAAMMLGVLTPGNVSRALQVAGAGAFAWLGFSFILNGQSHGLIATRMAALFGLPSAWSLFFLMAFIGGVTALLGFMSGTYVQRQIKAAD